MQLLCSFSSFSHQPCHLFLVAVWPLKAGFVCFVATGAESARNGFGFLLRCVAGKTLNPSQCFASVLPISVDIMFCQMSILGNLENWIFVAGNILIFICFAGKGDNLLNKLV